MSRPTAPTLPTVRPRRWAVYCVLALALALASAMALIGRGVDAASASGAQAGPADDLLVEIRPADVAVTLGDSVDITVSVTNRGATATDPLAVHIDITDPTTPGSVDPEDWTATLTRTTDRIEPGATADATWALHPISGGDFVVYAVALTPGTTDIHASTKAVDFSVTHQRTLNPQGVLPIAVAVPTAVAVLLAVQWRRPLRGARSTASDS